MDGRLVRNGRHEVVGPTEQLDAAMEAALSGSLLPEGCTYRDLDKERERVMALPYASGGPGGLGPDSLARDRGWA